MIRRAPNPSIFSKSQELLHTLWFSRIETHLAAGEKVRFGEFLSKVKEGSRESADQFV